MKKKKPRLAKICTEQCGEYYWKKGTNVIYRCQYVKDHEGSHITALDKTWRGSRSHSK